MGHAAITQVLKRAELAREDSDFTYFFSLLLAAEALTKTIVLGIVAAIGDDKDRHRYRLEHQLVRAEGLGDWSRAIEDALTGPASQHLLLEARTEQVELTKHCRSGDWQYDAVFALKAALTHLGVEAEDLPVRSDMKRWFRLFSTLRNKTRAHGATQPAKTSHAAKHLVRSVTLICDNLSLLRRPWAYLYRNLNGKYRVSAITDDAAPFESLKKGREYSYPNGVYLHLGRPRLVPLMDSDPELRDFFFANGGFGGKRFELLSYFSDDKCDGNASLYRKPPGVLPPSETEGHGELLIQGKCLSNAPELMRDYVSRPTLEKALLQLLQDDRRPTITLVGRGGIGKTSLALKAIHHLHDEGQYDAIVWLSARDVDLQLSGPKTVRPRVLSTDDMATFYASLVLPAAKTAAKGFNSRAYFEQQLQESDAGSCLFVFDNFETTQNPVEMFYWIDTYIRPPNKILITTRLRDFKGDYPLEVHGMDEQESRALINQTARSLQVSDLITEKYIAQLIAHSEGHPYVLKILLGEVAKAGRAAHIPRLVAGTEDILTALFERTYAALSPCAQRAFLTLAAWNSAVPRLALEAVLVRSTEERTEVEKGIDTLLQFSMAETQSAPTDKQEFISLPLVASVFGKKKLNISPYNASIRADTEILQMLGPSRRDDVHLGLAKKLERFVSAVSRRVDAGESFEAYAPILEMICRAYNPGWLLLARWHMESRSMDGYRQAKDELGRFLENEPEPADAAEAWRMLGHACHQTNDPLGEIHAFIERSQFPTVAFHDVSNTANRLNQLLRGHALGLDKDQRRSFALRILEPLERRRQEAAADDFSRMAWLAIHSGQEAKAREYAEAGLKVDPYNPHCQNLIARLNL